MYIDHFVIIRINAHLLIQCFLISYMDKDKKLGKRMCGRGVCHVTGEMCHVTGGMCHVTGGMCHVTDLNGVVYISITNCGHQVVAGLTNLTGRR